MAYIPFNVTDFLVLSDAYVFVVVNEITCIFNNLGDIVRAGAIIFFQSLWQGIILLR